MLLQNKNKESLGSQNVISKLISYKKWKTLLQVQATSCGVRTNVLLQKDKNNIHAVYVALS